MEEIRDYLPKIPWYRKTWGEIFIAVFLIGLISFSWLTVRILSEVKKLQTAQTVDFSVAANASSSVSNQPLAIKEEEQDARALGKLGSKLTIVEFADFGCPYSKEANYYMRELSAKYAERFRYLYRDFPVLELHPEAERAAVASRCAAEQEKFWIYHDRLYSRQDLTDDGLKQAAEQSGLQMDKFVSCLNSGKYEALVRAEKAQGALSGVRGTPTFFFNGVKVEGAIPREKLQELIEKFGG